MLSQRAFNTLLDRIICADALAFLRGLPNESVDAVITDPPYGLTDLSFDKPINLPEFWCEVKRVLRSPSSPVVVFSQQPFTTDLIISNRDWWKMEIVYEKSMPVGYLNANRRPLQCHELIEVFSDRGAYYNPVFEETSALVSTVKQRNGAADHYNAHVRSGGYDDIGKRYPRSVWKFAQRNTAFENTKTNHPTEKPLPLMRRLIETFCPEGGLILDPYAGSGSTLVAALVLGRRYIGCDISQEYVALANRRLERPYMQDMFLASAS